MILTEKIKKIQIYLTHLLKNYFKFVGDLFQLEIAGMKMALVDDTIWPQRSLY